jgi:hypothetical protein
MSDDSAYRYLQLKDCRMKFGSAFSTELEMIDQQYTADDLRMMTEAEFLIPFNEAIRAVREGIEYERTAKSPE